MRYLIFIGLSFSMLVSAQHTNDQLLDRLETVMINSSYFVDLKLESISSAMQEYERSRASDDIIRQLRALEQLCIEYNSFKFDSAFNYHLKRISLAYQSGSPEEIVNAKISFSDLLITAGIFTAAMDTLKSINIENTQNHIKAYYYKVLSRSYFDMESFSQSYHYSNRFREKGMSYFDSALLYLPPYSWEYLSIKAQGLMKQGENHEAIALFNEVINNYDLTNSELAAQLMMLSFLHGINGQSGKALEFMAEATIADIRSVKKEAVAMLFMANYLYESGDVMRASKYINIAFEDIQFYGSNFRMWQISQYLPVIKSRHILTIEQQKVRMVRLLFTLSILAFIVLVSLVIIFSQYNRIRKAKRIIERTNQKLSYINEELELANKIKEEYVGYYFSVSSQMIEKLDKYKNTLSRKIVRKQYEDLKFELENININREKQFLFNQFDEVFLKIFPDFVERFNQLLDPDTPIKPKKNQLLNTELRIFALIRLGITDNEKIARILDYSVNTVYTYKTKVKNMARVPKDQFDKEVLRIKRF